MCSGGVSRQVVPFAYRSTTGGVWPRIVRHANEAETLRRISPLNALNPPT